MTAPRYGSAIYGSGVRYASAAPPPPPPPISPSGKHRKPRNKSTSMNDQLTNELNMAGACIAVADQDEHKAVWEGNEPTAFETDLTALKARVTAATALQSQLEGGNGGSADAKENAETFLEDLAFRMARALANYFYSINDLENFGKVDVVKSDITRLRHQALTARCEGIRDLANGVSALPAAIARGITAAKVTALSAAITAFNGVRHSPRAVISDNAAKRRDLTTDVAAIVTSIRMLDDLVDQFDGDAGEHFREAWKNARTIVDLGHRFRKPETPVTPPTPPTP